VREFIFSYTITKVGVFSVKAQTLQEAEDAFNGTALKTLDECVNKEEAEINYNLCDEREDESEDGEEGERGET
jgi:hypothetical protein